jgi:hypothetical protein
VAISRNDMAYLKRLTGRSEGLCGYRRTARVVEQETAPIRRGLPGDIPPSDLIVGDRMADDARKMVWIGDAVGLAIVANQFMLRA